MGNHKIVRLQAENVKVLKVVEIRPDGNVIVIGGKNGAGKTSLIDSIAYALGGTKMIPGEPVRKGQSKATIIADLGDLIVERTITHKGTALTVKNRKGVRQASPQKILDGFHGKWTFDPLDFSRQPAKTQALTLKELAGLDSSSADEARAECYEQRTAVNRDLAKTEARMEELAFHEDAPDEEVSVAGLIEELKTAQKTNADNAQRRQQVEKYKDDIDAHQRECEILREKIAELSLHLTGLEGTKDAMNEKYRDYKTAAAELEDADDGSIQTRISNAGELNNKLQENQGREKLEHECEALSRQSEALTTKIDKIDADKAASLRDAKLPIAGLGLNDAGVTYEGIPFEQCSSAEQLRISVAMGIALNPELRVLLIRDGSLLDEDSLKTISAMAEEADAQVWIEVVTGDPDKASVIIESGEVKESP